MIVLKTEQEKFLSALQSVAGIVERRHTLPILANVLLYASQQGKRGPKPPILAKHGPTSGSAIVILLAVAQALTYMYEWSEDQVTWQSMIAGHTRVTIAGLTPGKTYWFRARAFLRNGTTTDPVGVFHLIVV